MRTVLVTRPQPVADELAERIRAGGHRAYVAPMMEYVAVAAAFPDLAGYQALIFTSREGVRHFCDMSAARDLPVLAVGDATAAAAAQAGFARIFSAKGNGAAVAALAKEEAPGLGLKKILHPCSADTPDDISAALESAGVAVVRRPVYKAALTEKFPAEAAAALRAGLVDTVMLFSTRTAVNFVRLLRQNGLDGQSPEMEAICISKAVAEPLHALRWRGVRVASKPQLGAVMQALAAADKADPADRRRKTDRRARDAQHDADGNIIAKGYAGPDRRRAARRAHEQMQRQRIWQEKMKFVNRSMLTFAFMFAAIVLAGVFLMAPEYARIDHVPLAGGGQSVMGRIGGMVGHGLDTVESAVGLSPAQPAAPPPKDYTQVLYNLSVLRRQDGDAAAERALARLQAAMAAPDVQTPQDIARVVAGQRRQSGALNSLFGSLGGDDVAAGAMLLALNEFRGDVNSGRPYAEDLAVLQKFTGNDPRMNRALSRLAPYAATGVLNRRALQAELGGLLVDVIKAEMTGQDISVQQDAQARYARLVKAGNLAAVQGSSSAATVARAQILLDEGNVAGATELLETLQGPAAGVVQPWMQQATAYNATSTAGDSLTQGILYNLSSVGATSAQTVMEEIKESLGMATVPYVSPALTVGQRGGGDTVAPTSLFP